MLYMRFGAEATGQGILRLPRFSGESPVTRHFWPLPSFAEVKAETLDNESEFLNYA